MDIFSPLLEWIGNNLIQSLIFTFIGILATAFFTIFYIKNRKPCKWMKSNSLVKDLVIKYQGLDITYNNETVKNLTVTNVKFWNEGKQTIMKTDIADADPIVIEVKEGYKILNSSILKMTDNRNQFQLLTLDDRRVKIDFDYIDCNDGVAVQILHTGLSSEDIQLKGKVKEVKEIKNKSRNNTFLYKITAPLSKYISKKNERIITLAVTVVMPVVLMLFVLISPADSSLSSTRFNDQDYKIVMIIFTIIMATVNGYLLYTISKRIGPKELEIDV